MRNKTGINTSKVGLTGSIPSRSQSRDYGFLTTTYNRRRSQAIAEPTVAHISDSERIKLHARFASEKIAANNMADVEGEILLKFSWHISPRSRGCLFQSHQITTTRSSYVAEFDLLLRRR